MIVTSYMLQLVSFFSILSFSLDWFWMDCSFKLNDKHMLELLKGKRVAFVGDSLDINMWEYLICVLKNSVEEKSNVFEAFGRHELRTKGSYSILFKDVCPLFFSFDADYLQTCSQRVFFPILKEKEKSFSCIWIY